MSRPKWKMPEWMKKYEKFICNTGGNPVEDLQNGNTDAVINLPLAVLECAVQSQVSLLYQLHKEGIIE